MTTRMAGAQVFGFLLAVLFCGPLLAQSGAAVSTEEIDRLSKIREEMEKLCTVTSMEGESFEIQGRADGSATILFRNQLSGSVTIDQRSWSGISDLRSATDRESSRQCVQHLFPLIWGAGNISRLQGFGGYRFGDTLRAGDQSDLEPAISTWALGDHPPHGNTQVDNLSQRALDYLRTISLLSFEMPTSGDARFKSYRGSLFFQENVFVGFELFVERRASLWCDTANLGSCRAQQIGWNSDEGFRRSEELRQTCSSGWDMQFVESVFQKIKLPPPALLPQIRHACDYQVWKTIDYYSNIEHIHDLQGHRLLMSRETTFSRKPENTGTIGAIRSTNSNLECVTQIKVVPTILAEYTYSLNRQWIEANIADFERKYCPS